MKIPFLPCFLGWCLCLAATIDQSVLAQTPTPAAPTMISAEAARADLAQLYQTLQHAHFDLYANRSHSDYEQRYQQLRRKLEQPISAFDLQIELQKFTAYGQVAHARIDFPALEFERYRAAGGSMLPLELKLRDGRIFVVGNPGSESQPQAGDQILSINGEPAAAWRSRLLAHVSADNDYLADTLLELRFGALLWLELGEVASVQLDLRSADGSLSRVSVATLDRAQMRLAAEKRSPSLALNWSKREARMLDRGLAYLRPGPFYNDDPEAASVWDSRGFSDFVERSFAQFAEANANSLLIDLRDNPGGDNSFSDLIVRRIADKPFRFCSQFRIKISEATTASNAARLAQGFSEVSAQFAELYAGQQPGEVVNFELPWVEPAPPEERFSGQVYVLINRYSYSNAVTVAAMSQDYGFATILGEETADLASTYGAMEQFTLKNSGLVVGYPKAHIIRPNGDPSRRGVVPDIAIETPLLEGAEDPVVQKAVDVIGELSVQDRLED